MENKREIKIEDIKEEKIEKKRGRNQSPGRPKLTEEQKIENALKREQYDQDRVRPGRPKLTKEELDKRAEDRKKKYFEKRLNLKVINGLGYEDIKYKTFLKKERIKKGLFVANKKEHSKTAKKVLSGKKRNGLDYIEREKPTVTVYELEEMEKYGLRRYFMDKALTHKEVVFLMEYADSPLTRSICARRAGISASGLVNMRTRNALFQELMTEIENIAVDNVENSLYELSTSGNVKALEIFLKAKAKDRGYGEVKEQQEVRVVSELNLIDINENGEELDDTELLRHFDIMERAVNDENNEEVENGEDN